MFSLLHLATGAGKRHPGANWQIGELPASCPRWYRLALGAVRADRDDVEEDDDEEFDDVLLARLQTIARSRYLCPCIYCKQEPRFAWFMADCSDREFLRSFRMDRTSFAKLAELIRENISFTTTPGKKMATSTCQLMIFLKFIETHCLDAYVENRSALFGVASGSCFDYVKRVGSALLELYDDIVCWPSESERKAIADRICASYDFPNSVGVMDGTLLPLAFRPALNGEDYFMRKGASWTSIVLMFTSSASPPTLK